MNINTDSPQKKYDQYSIGINASRRPVRIGCMNSMYVMSKTNKKSLSKCPLSMTRVLKVSGQPSSELGNWF
jgi:hypothetical protein